MSNFFFFIRHLIWHIETKHTTPIIRRNNLTKKKKNIYLSSSIRNLPGQYININTIRLHLCDNGRYILLSEKPVAFQWSIPLSPKIRKSLRNQKSNRFAETLASRYPATRSYRPRNITRNNKKSFSKRLYTLF